MLYLLKNPGTVVPNRGPQLLGANIACIVVSLMTLALRCFVRVRMVRAFGRDDAIMCIAGLLFFLYTTSSDIGVHYGTGRHYTDLTTEQDAQARHAWYICFLLYAISMMCIKLSVGLMLLRVSQKKAHKWILYGAMFVSVVSGGTLFFVCMFQCYPIPFIWDKSGQGSCYNTHVIAALAYVYSTFSIMSDFTFALIPGFIIWELQLKRRAKAALVPLIIMGCAASAGVLVRMPYLKYFDSPDFLWATVDIALFSTVEQGLAMTAGNLATLRPLFFKGGSNRRPSAQAGYDRSTLPGSGTRTSPNSGKSDMYWLGKFNISKCNETRTSVEVLVPLQTEPTKPSNAYMHHPNTRSSNEPRLPVITKTFYLTDEEQGPPISPRGNLR